MEEWKDIKGYEGIYQVSKNGVVKSLHRLVKGSYGSVMFKKSRILKPRINKFGYLRVDLSIHGKSKAFFLHRVIAFAYINNPYNKPFINHKDGNKLNNEIGNLEWCTGSENMKHAVKMGLLSTTHLNCVLRKLENPAAKKVQCLFTGEIMCMTDAAIMLQMERKALSAMMNGRGENWCGFIFI